MKKILTLAAAFATAIGSWATDYNDEMAITLNGQGPMRSAATVAVDEVPGTDGDYNITLKQFSFQGLLIGDVTMTNVKGDSDSDGNVWFETEQDAQITNGEMIATMLGGKVHVTIKEGSRLNNGKLYLVISLPVALSAAQTFDVDAVFGTGGYQIANSDFELFHKAEYKDGDKTYSSDEPNAWHSFNSGVATGTMASLTKYALQNGSTSIADDVRPGSLGTKSVKLTSAIVMGFQPANGTMTTGRLQAGSISATDPANCSFLDMSKTDVDGNGDPFYTAFSGTPDSLAVWVKFKQGALSDDNKDYKYATISAIITDGTYYQDPEPKDAAYTNVVAKAKNDKIESLDFAWQRISIPFDYDKYADNNAAKKALLVTVSTNAQPGVAAKNAKDPDQLLVDDIEMVYNHQLEALQLKGVDVEGFAKNVYEYNAEVEGKITEDEVKATADGRGAIVKKAIEDTDNGQKLTVTVLSNDYTKSSVYTVNLKDKTSGITDAKADNASEAVETYNISGQKVSGNASNGIFIVRKADGTTVKVIRK